MLSVFGGVKDYVKRSNSKPDVEGLVYRLHYRVTAVILLVCCLLVTAVEYVGLGTRISCFTGIEEFPMDVINTYCFITSTFTIPRGYRSRAQDFAHPGVGARPSSEEDRVYQAYYQWVPFVLFLQCCLFYLPHLIFKRWEEGKVNGIICGLHRPEILVKPEERVAKHRALGSYFLSTINTHNSWAIRLYLADFVIFANAVANIYLIDVLLGGEFSTYGLQVLKFVQEEESDRIDPITYVFPKMTKCTYKKFGPSGSLENIDALCLLPINVINEKIFVFLWFWLVLLAFITSLSLVLHFSQLLLPTIVEGFIRRKVRNKVTFNRLLECIKGNLWLGDWKLLYILAYNMPSVILGEFVEELDNLVHEKGGMFEETEEDTNANVTKPLLTPI